MSGKVNFETDPDQSMIYQIRLKGYLPGKWSGWFGGMTVTLEESGDTLLTGSVKDQAALHGLLKQVRDLGMPLISVNRIYYEVKKMNSNRRTSIIVGVLILAAYGVLASLFTELLTIIVALELMSGAAVITIAVLMFPILKPWKKRITLGYLASKVIEGGLMIIAGILLLSNSSLLLGIRDFIHVSHAYFFILASMLFYFLLYQSKLIPRFISVWGVIALVSLLIGNLLEITGNTHPMIMLFYPLIMLNEVFLAIWLIVKGFNPSTKTKIG